MINSNCFTSFEFQPVNAILLVLPQCSKSRRTFDFAESLTFRSHLGATKSMALASVSREFQARNATSVPEVT